MALPTPVKTWQFNNNQTISGGGSVAGNNKLILLAIKTTLRGFASSPWTTAYSCNSVTAGSAGDGVDRWSTVADIVLATAGTAHSWYVFKQAGLLSNFQVLVSASPEGTAYANTNIQFSVFISPSAGFTGGSTTARPTATDEQNVSNMPNNTSWFGSNPASGNVWRLHGQQSTDGACTRLIFCGNNLSTGMLQFDQATNSVTGWTNPFVVTCGGIGLGNVGVAATSYPLTSQMCNTAVNVGYNRFIRIGTTYGLAIFTEEGNNTALASPDTTYGNLANEVDGLWPIYPIGVASGTVGIRGRHGSLIDMWWGSSAVASGDTYDLTSKTFVQFGNIIVPWDGTTTPAMA